MEPRPAPQTWRTKCENRFTLSRAQTIGVKLVPFFKVAREVALTYSPPSAGFMRHQLEAGEFSRTSQLL